MSERAPGSSDSRFDRRDVVRGLAALFATSTAPNLSAWASRELGDLAPDELLIRIQKELKPGGSMRNWLEEKDGKRTTREIVKFLKSLLPIVEELEKSVWGKSSHNAFQEKNIDTSSIPHLYQIELDVRADSNNASGKIAMGNGSLLEYNQRVYFVTARHVIAGTSAEDLFRFISNENGEIPDIVAVSIDFERSRPYLEEVRGIEVSPSDEVMQVTEDLSPDRGGEVVYFVSELRNDFDATPRLCIPMTPAVSRAFDELMHDPRQGRYKPDQKNIAKLHLEHDSIVLGPAEFSERLPIQALGAQGRSGGIILAESTTTKQFVPDGTFSAVGSRGITELDNRSILFTNRRGELQRLLATLDAHSLVPIVLFGSNGIRLKAPSRWQTTVQHAGK